MDSKFDTSGEIIELNRLDARFIPWSGHTSGGFLRWIQDDTYVELDSGELSKNEMIKIAKSMK
ncbi:DUF4367 domain-containing protein [Paenibacillus mucilaginosus]|uniref:DUF4367 domain-containing protein n=1 Tax=Paenibacillus mucilaginosus (strain KNP414) TaxID=1036673 RepID=F8FEZ6_PAEMK|nr:hypothetical protein KNP414_01128 [Paenibacillus mucilaginosus KNP414]